MADGFDMIEIGALWKSKSGKTFSGMLGKARLVIMVNQKKKEGDRQPDFRVFIAPSNEERQPAAAPASTGASSDGGDDIPF